MNFSFTADQHMLADGVRDFLNGECTVEAVQRAWIDGPDPERWKAMAALGIVGLLAHEDHGGMGMREVDLTLLLEAAGRAGLPEPLAEVAAVAVPLLGEIGGPVATDLIERVARGELVVLPALASDRHPVHLAMADQILMQRGDALHLVAAETATLKAQPNVDGARPTATLSIDALHADTLLADDAGKTLARANARGAWAASAQLVGAGRRVIDLATAYALQREQFGKPIGSFQAVKHRLASALVAIEFARPLVHRAAFSLATNDPNAALHASMAKAVAAEAAQQAAKASLQVHGAIGYTWEHPLHLFMKRIWSLSSAWGSTEQHWQAIEVATR
jgi:alkylation response protein AidB-like acyl-CoA dehydrogenase